MSEGSANQTTFGHDVFVSYASQDAAVANSTVENLEQRGVQAHADDDRDRESPLRPHSVHLSQIQTWQWRTACLGDICIAINDWDWPAADRPV